MERIQLATLAVAVGAPLLVLGLVDQTVNHLFFKIYGSRALTSSPHRLANAVTKIVLGTAVMGAAAFLISLYLTSLGLSRAFFHVAWSINLLCISGYLLYVMKEKESHAKACILDRIKPRDFYSHRSYYRTLVIWSELAKEIKIKYECFYSSENPQKYGTIPDQFNELISQNSVSLKTVKKLDLHDVDFTQLGLRLDQFHQLESLNLESSKNVAIFLSNTSSLLNQLKTINLTSTGLATFPDSLVSQCPNLEELNISSNEIMTLPEATSLPMTLKKLVISKNQLIKTIPDSLLRMPIGCGIEVAGIFDFDTFYAFYLRILDIRKHTSFQHGVDLHSSWHDSAQIVRRRLALIDSTIASILTRS